MYRLVELESGLVLLSFAAQQQLTSIGGSQALPEKDISEIDGGLQLENIEAAVHLPAEDGLLLIKARRHVDVLLPYAWEEEGHRPLCSLGGSTEAAVGALVSQRLYHLFPGPPDHCQTLAKLPPPALEGEGNVGQVDAAVGFQRCGQILAHRFQPRRRLGRQRQKIPRLARRSRRQLRTLLQNDMRIGPAHTQRRYPRSSGRGRSWQLVRLVLHEERAVLQIHLRIGPLEMQRCRHQPRAQYLGGLDHADRACCAVGMAEVGLDRTQSAELLLRRCLAECARQCRHFDGIAQLGGRAVRLDVVDIPGGQPGIVERHGDHFRLAFHTRCSEPDLERAVVIDSRSLDHGMDRVAVFLRILQPLQQHHGNAVGEHRALRPSVEGAGVAIRRTLVARLEQMAVFAWHMQRHTAGKRHIRLAGPQALTGQMNGHAGGRTVGADRQTRSFQIELVRDTGGKRIRRVGETDLERIEPRP